MADVKVKEVGEGGEGMRALNRLAALGAVLPLAALVFDIWASLAHGAAPSGQRPAAEWFGLFARDPLLGLQGLSFPQVVSTVCGIPLTLALFLNLRGANRGLAWLALCLGLVGAGLFLDANAALPMWALSGQWQAAGSEAGRQAIEAAGAAILARAADFTPAGFLDFCLPSLSGLLLAAAMRQAPAFGRPMAWLGLGGYGLLLAFTAGACFVPGGFAALMPLSLAGGLALMAWQVWVAVKLWRLA